ncbi:MAG: hypothetical protein V4596_03265 [Bdellovibrionota bacterium]
MNQLIPLILSLFIAMSAQATQELPITSNIEKPQDAPKYSALKKLSNAEVLETLEQFTGRPDRWKNQKSLITRLKKIIPFQGKTTVEEERLALSYAYAKRSETALQEYVFSAYNSNHPEIKGTVVAVRGDKRLVLNSFILSHNYDLRGILLFFQSIEFGDTGLETKKFLEFALAFDSLSLQVSRAYDRAVELKMPLIIEFESSALMAKSPLTRVFFNTLINNPEQILKAEVTPDGGRVLAIHPFYAAKIVKNLNLFTDQFRLKVNTLRNRIFKDPEAKQRLLDLIRNGEGFSGVLYTDERIQQLAIIAEATSTKNCSQLF